MGEIQVKLTKAELAKQLEPFVLKHVIVGMFFCYKAGSSFF
jgi:hypothetical protein